MLIQGRSSAILEIPRHNVKAFQDGVFEKYGDSLSEQYAADFIAFIETLRAKGVI